MRVSDTHRAHTRFAPDTSAPNQFASKPMVSGAVAMACPSTTLRAAASRSANARSAVVVAMAPGVFPTGTPAAVASAATMWSHPAPKLLITERLGSAASTAASTAGCRCTSNPRTRARMAAASSPSRVMRFQSPTRSQPAAFAAASASGCSASGNRVSNSTMERACSASAVAAPDVVLATPSATASAAIAAMVYRRCDRLGYRCGT